MKIVEEEDGAFGFDSGTVRGIGRLDILVPLLQYSRTFTPRFGEGKGNLPKYCSASNGKVGKSLSMVCMISDRDPDEFEEKKAEMKTDESL